MGQDNSNRHRDGNPRWFSSLAIAGTALTLLACPVFAQPAAGHASTGNITATRSMAPGRSIGAPVGAPIHGGPRLGTTHANSFGASSAPPPSWELPKYVTPHWEIGPNVQVQPNPVQGNHVRRDRGAFGVGFAGLPDYVDPMAFVNASDDDTAEQAQPAGPARPDYGPQAPYPAAPYGEGPYDQGYGAPPRPPYSPEGYPAPQQQSTAATQSDGLDHPAVTLVFNDGRPPEQVHSYVLTGSSVFVAEHGHQRVIPIAELDLPATIAQNREAGVDFTLPGGSR
ncbi:MAG TPA: hypothetical protein VGG59_07255 [Acidobacteriaceae bacterium]|jgi:hypothetical protein